MTLRGVAEEPAGQTEENERARVVPKRGVGDLVSDVSEQRRAGDWIATESGGDSPREIREHPLLGVIAVGGLLDPDCTLADSCHIVDPEAGQCQLGERPGVVLIVEPLGGGGEKLDCVGH